jgi:AcrR family transcriptional regulator
MKMETDDWPKKKIDIVLATIAVVADVGLDKATTAMIAKAAGAGEGTIYRHFQNKEDLIFTSAIYASGMVFSKPRNNYNPELPIEEQYRRFCCDFLSGGGNVRGYHIFLEQFIDSPAGIEYRRNTLENLEQDPDIRPLIYPINRIIQDGLGQGAVKKMPLVVLIGLTMGPITFLMKNASEGHFSLTKELIDSISQSCWAAVRR